jgi:hypothetical protein
VRAAAVEAVGKFLLYGGLALIAVVGLLVWKGGSMPAWLTIVIVALVLTVALGSGGARACLRGFGRLTSVGS